jgi:hypothetical protein
MRALILALFLATPAAAQTALSLAPRLYGSASDPTLSCDTNPHELSFIENPPHAIFQWRDPRPDPDGYLSREDTYDLRGATDSTLTLLREGDARLPDTGRRPVWILRLTQKPAGYCWGREDWPMMRCEQQQLRCEVPIS